MTLQTSAYVRAYIDSREETDAKEYGALDQSFIKTIFRHGDGAHAEAILERLEQELVARAGGRSIVVESARELTKKVRDDLMRNFTNKDLCVFAVSPDLVAGVRITFNGERELDATFKKKLKHLFI